jgi:chitinase
LQQLRRDPVGKLLAITAAAGSSPWLGANNSPIKDVSEFSKVLDYVAIMNYDIWGPWSPTVGPNAPLEDSCAPQAARVGSASSAVQVWTKAKMPLDKLVLGVPAYGHSYRVLARNAYSNGKIALYPKFDASHQPAGDAWDGQPAGSDVCGVKSTQPGGIINYWGMISLGYIDNNGNPKTGRKYRFDTCSKTVCILVQFEVPDLSW